jgi:hypothetical protein
MLGTPPPNSKPGLLFTERQDNYKSARRFIWLAILHARVQRETERERERESRAEIGSMQLVHNNTGWRRWNCERREKTWQEVKDAGLDMTQQALHVKSRNDKLFVQT